MLLLIALVALLLTSWMLYAVLPLRGRLAMLLAVACLSFGQVVLLTEILSEMQRLNAAGYAVGHGLLLAGAALLWLWRGRPTLWPNIPVEASLAPTINALVQAIRHNPLLSLFACAVIALSLINLLLSFPVETQGADEVAYHLSRIYFWAQNETARHFTTFDPRHTDFPPNASYNLLWLMLLSGGTAGLHLPSWLAGIVTAIATAGLVRLAGHSQRAAIFTALLLLTTTGTILQMASRHNDVLTAVLSLCFFYFALRAMNPQPKQRSAALVYAGIAFGLALGTKFTFVLLLPGLGLALLIYGWRRHGRAVLHVLVALGLSCLIGFALFGAYNYALNYANFGDPLSSRPLSDSSAINEGTPRRDNLYGLGTNLIRYLWQMVDWAGIADDNSHTVYLQMRGLFASLSDSLDLDPENVPEFTFDHVGLRPLDFYTSGYGLQVYPFLIASPLMMLVFAWKARRSRRYELPALLLFVAWAWILLTAGILPWDPYRLRFFMLIVPLLLAALLPWLVTQRRIAILWLLPLMLLGLWTAYHATFDTFGRYEWLRGQDYDEEGLGLINAPERDMLHTLVPPGSTLGITGHELRLWDFVNALPEYRFEMVLSDQVPDYLATNDTGLMLSPMRSCVEDGDTRYLYFPINPLFACLLIGAPSDFLSRPEVIEFYGYDLAPTRYQTYLRLDPARAMLHEDEYRVDVNLALDFFATEDLRIDLRYSSGGLSEDTLFEITCNDDAAAYELYEDGLTIYFDRSQVIRRQVFQRCQVLHHYNPALRVASALIYPHAPPPPDSLPAAAFESGPDLLAADLPDSATACDTLYLSFWWRGATEDLEQVVYLSDANSRPLVESSIALNAQDGLSRHFIDLPCDLVAGTYQLMMRLVDSGSALRLGDGNSLLPLGSIIVQAN